MQRTETRQDPQAEREEIHSGLWLSTVYPQLLHLHLPALQNQEQDLQRWKWEPLSVLLQVRSSSTQNGSRGSKERSCPCSAKHQGGSQGQMSMDSCWSISEPDEQPHREDGASLWKTRVKCSFPQNHLKEQPKTKGRFCLNHNSCAKFTSMFLL